MAPSEEQKGTQHIVRSPYKMKVDGVLGYRVHFFQTRINPVENEMYPKWDITVEVFKKQPMKNAKWNH